MGFFVTFECYFADEIEKMINAAMPINMFNSSTGIRLIKIMIYDNLMTITNVSQKL
jgi:hypothetical protein